MRKKIEFQPHPTDEEISSSVESNIPADGGWDGHKIREFTGEFRAQASEFSE